ncbi:F-box protein At5g07610-like [Triticum dicoccoides]|uniref:F-box protein At5g07610-like n=1 Tax=Triticum dicoccoides TaxID=85692 RepID=UPI00188EC767|nr:F-box protein At5g07610-like [Triticum dicoccoides]
MPPGGGGEEGDEHGSSTVQSHPPATVHREEDTPQLPTISAVASKEKKQKLEQQPVPSLPEGALVEILSRVPYRSLCRFKCVSKPWLVLCSARDILKRSPQTLSGFFYKNAGVLKFRNLSGRGLPLVDPSLPFLRQRYENVHVEQLCEGLLLCSCWNSCSACENDYVVCNPATQEWTVLPPVVFPAQECSHPWKKGIPMTYLGFEAAVPTRFMVFATPYNADHLPGQMAIYSSKTGQWTYVQTKWSSVTHVDCSRRTHVFLNGTMHLATLCNSIIPTVDVEGKVWKEIQMPVDWTSCNIVLTGQSQGRLYAWQVDYCDDSELDIWVLEDYGTGKWTLKHTVNVSELFGRHCRKDGDFYQMFAIHPDCNVIFLTNQKKKTVSYDMDNQKVHVICDEFMIGLPYTPCFAELPSAGH